MSQMIKYLPLFIFLFSCNGLFSSKTPLVFKEKKTPIIDTLSAEEQRLKLLKEKEAAWKLIVTEAKDTFESIAPIIKNKCQDCHNSKKDLPSYGRILKKINPVYDHYVNGIKALDFSDTFPLKAQGNPLQISLLKAIRESATDRSMPLKAYTLVYRKRKLTKSDEELIIAWVDPLIQKIEDFDLRYNHVEGNEGEAHKILEQKCFRCHANGVSKGKFGGMENAKGLVKAGYIKPLDPESSSLFKIMENKKMPPNPKEALTEDELMVVRDWFGSLGNP